MGMDSCIHVYGGRMFIRLIGCMYMWLVVYMVNGIQLYNHPRVRAIADPMLYEVVIALHKHICSSLNHKHICSSLNPHPHKPNYTHTGLNREAPKFF